MIEYFRATLEADADTLVSYATKAIAHTHRKGAPKLTWGELSTAIDDIGAGCQHFGALFHGTHYELLPIVDDDWQSTFRQWLFEPYRERRDFNFLPGG